MSKKLDRCNGCKHEELRANDLPCWVCSVIYPKYNTCMYEPIRDISANEYQKKALRTARTDEFTDRELLTNGIMGLVGETGELVDLLKKHWYQGHDLDIGHLEKELGDISWYLALTAYAVGAELGSIFLKNIEKLQARYPDGFDSEKSLHRAEGDV